MIRIVHLPFKVIHWNFTKENIPLKSSASIEFFGIPMRNEYTTEVIGFRIRWTMRLLDDTASYISEDSYQVSKSDIMLISETDFLDLAAKSFTAFRNEYSKRTTELGFSNNRIENIPIPREETLVMLYEMKTKW
jgi:hypothetical protein